jgi:hypothetical protein
MKYLIACLTLLLAGCLSTAPIKPKFPEVPAILTERCESLKKVEGDKVAITEMLKVVVQNYALYYECSTKVEGWNEWYEGQKKIYDSVK